MSYHSRHRKLLKGKGCVVSDGTTRGGSSYVGREMKVCKANDTLMQQQCHTLYGNTKYTDEQIFYFLDKHKHSVTKAATDLGCSSITIRNRLISLGISPCPDDHSKSPKRKGITTKDMIKAMEKHKGVFSKACKSCNIALTTGRYHLYKNKPEAEALIKRLKKAGITLTVTSTTVMISNPHKIYIKTKTRKLLLVYKWCIISILYANRSGNKNTLKVGKNGITGPKARKALKECSGNKTRAAAKFKLNMLTFNRWLKR